MADPLDIYLSGVPNVSAAPAAPSVFGTGVSLPQVNKLVRDRVAGQSQILEFRDRVATLQGREQARLAGQAALGQITQLDPANDPDYQKKVMGVLARNPAATLDSTVNNFLGIQESIYNDSQAARQAVLDAQRKQEEEARLFALRREQNQILLGDEVSSKRKQELIAGIESLDLDEGKEFDRLVQKGVPRAEALKRTMQKSQDQQEINLLRENGFKDTEIFGVPDAKGGYLRPGLVDDQGRIDPAKLSLAVGEKKRMAAEQDLVKEREGQNQKRYSLLKDYYDELTDVERTTLADPEEIKRVESNLLSLRKELGLTVGDAPAATGTTAAPTVKKDILRTDRYLQ